MSRKPDLINQGVLCEGCQDLLPGLNIDKSSIPWVVTNPPTYPLHCEKCRTMTEEERIEEARDKREAKRIFELQGAA